MHTLRPRLRQWLRSACALALLLLFGSGLLGAQTVGGTVTGEDGLGLIGATVLEVGTTNGTQTDLDGGYTLQLTSASPVLRFSYVGYLSREEQVDGRQTVDLVLSEDAKTLSDVVVIGYGTQTRATISGAVGTVGTEALEGRPVASFQSALQGQLPGLQITSNSGAPGGASNVRVRGTGSITGGSNPLYVVDGVIISNGVGIAGDPFSTINPSDIASVTVLKDASAAAIYGARAANGVIIITTKRGRGGEPRINVSTYVGSQSATNTLDLLDAEQYRTVRNNVADNSGEKRIPNLDGTTLVNDTDWQDAVFQNGLIQNYELSASGGSDKINYYTSFGHYSEEGTIIGTGLERTSLRLNTDTRRGRFKFGNSLTVSRTSIEREYDALGLSLLASTLLSPPTVAIRDPNNIGGFSGSTTADGDFRVLNPVAAQTLVDRTGVTNRILGSVFGELEIAKGLNYRINFGADASSFRNRLFAPFFDLGSGESVPGLDNGAEVSENLGDNLSLLLENTLNFRRNFNGNSIDLLGGYTVQRDRTSAITVTTVGQNISPQLPVLSGSAISPSPPSGFQVETRTVSYLGRMQYDFRERYLAEFNFRRDGSSIFTRENYFDNFFSGSVGWVLSNEAFLLGNETISNLKLRASYGFLGNDQINETATLALLNSDARYIFGRDQAVAPALAPGSLIANPNLKWERQRQLNVGVDVGLLDGRLNVTADYFVKTSEDLLLNFPLPSATGFTNIFLNAAEVENSGLELALAYNGTAGEFTYSASANAAVLDNKVKSLAEGLDAIERNASNVFTARNRIEPGQSLFAFYGYEVEGIYQSQEEIAAGPTPLSNTAPGDLRFRDVSGDGKITEDDRTFIGDANQDLTYGFAFNVGYRGLSLSAQFQGVAGNQIFNETKYYTQSYSRVSNLTTDVLNAWTPENPSTTQPRAVNPTLTNNDLASSFFVEDGGYLRLKNLQLGYQLQPTAVARVPGLASARVYVAAQNLLTFTKYSGYDPEVGGGGGFGFDNIGYPQSRRVTVGLSVGF